MINVIFCADANYVQHLGVTLASLLSNNLNNQFLITVVTCKRKPAWESALAQIAAAHRNASIRFKRFDLSRVAHLETDHHATASVYMRLFMTEFVDDSVNKALYLDSDLIVCRDIGPLWMTDIAGYALAAVRESPEARYVLGRSIPSGRYFNSGVLLVNLDRWRRSGAPKHFIKLAEEHDGKVTWWDQDILNAVYCSETYLLDLEWNFQARMADCTADELQIEPGYFAIARESPAIVHFTGSTKPWGYGAKVPYMELYFKYLALTPWRGYTPRETLRAKLHRIPGIDDMKRLIKSRFPGRA
jgi:lipopolysaccharide biosynthesis glycosyltransferase